MLFRLSVMYGTVNQDQAATRSSSLPTVTVLRSIDEIKLSSVN